jgi:hypothetical protein
METVRHQHHDSTRETWKMIDPVSDLIPIRIVRTPGYQKHDFIRLSALWAELNEFDSHAFQQVFGANKATQCQQKTEENNRNTGCPLPPSLGYLQYSRAWPKCQPAFGCVDPLLLSARPTLSEANVARMPARNACTVSRCASLSVPA